MSGNAKKPLWLLGGLAAGMLAAVAAVWVAVIRQNAKGADVPDRYRKGGTDLRDKR